MDEEAQELVKENIRLTRENNRLLRKLWKAEIWSFWSKMLFIVVMIGIPVLVYQYYLADVLEDLQNTYQSVFEGVGKLKEIPEQVSLSAVLEGLEDRGRELIE